MIKKLLCIPFAFFALSLTAQTIPNLSLDQWDNFGDYEEPSGGVWATANKVVQLSGLYPVTTTKTPDAHSGAYAAQIVTDEIPLLNLLVTGTLSTGEFDAQATPPNNLLRGTPYTGRPGSFRGWYKFTSVQGDSCSIYAWLHKWNGSGRDTIGFAGMFPDQTVATYTQWDIPFDYKSSDDPDSISIVFASSAAGESFQGQPGNTLIVDELELTTATGIPQVLMAEIGATVYPNPASEFVDLRLEEPVKNAVVDIYAVTGQMVRTVDLQQDYARIEVQDLPRGTYHYVVRSPEANVVSGTFLVQ